LTRLLPTLDRGQGRRAGAARARPIFLDDCAETLRGCSIDSATNASHSHLDRQPADDVEAQAYRI